MQLEPKHDYSAVEKALAQNEAPARMRIMTGQGLRALAVMVGMAILALALGWAWYIAKEPKVEVVEKTVEVEKIVEVPSPSTQMPQVPNQPSGSKIVRNFVVFQEVDASMIRNGLRVYAGHKYATSEQRDYDYAYCYALIWRDSDGVEVRLRLSEKANATDRPEFDNLGNPQAVGLTDAQADEAASLCPYIGTGI